MLLLPFLSCANAKLKHGAAQGMAFNHAPAAFIFLINLIIIFFAITQPQRAGTRVFQMVLGVALCCWSGGLVAYDYVAGLGMPNEWVFIFPAISVMLIPAGFLSFALSFPQPLKWVEKSEFPLVSLYLPPLILVSFTRYSELAGSYLSYSIVKDIWERRVWTAYPLLIVSTLYLVLAAWLFDRRLKESKDQNDQQLFRWILYSFIGTLTFTVAMLATAGTRMGEMQYPAPSLLLALLGQLGLLCAVRHLQETTPEEVSRAVFLPLLALVIVFMLLLGEMMVSALLRTDFLNDLQMSVLLLFSVSVSLFAVLLREDLQKLFDRFFFNRAYIYRERMREMHTELREARERLSRAERMAIVGEVAASVAHEIKNPLGPIKGYTQMILRLVDKMEPTGEKDRMIRGLNIIGEEVDKINERVMRLLEFSRSEQLELKPCQIEEVVRRAVDLARGESLGERRDLEIEVRAQPDLPLVAGDPFRLHEAFFNIIQNGVQAMNGRGRLEIDIRGDRTPDGRLGVEVRFRDYGKGMSLEEARQAFKPFYTTREGGAGLGLGVVKNAIQAHRGEISISTNPNQGATIVVWLPAEETP